ncbi:MAG: spermidine synthase, partial [Halobacteriaceae archaeon]
IDIIGFIFGALLSLGALRATQPEIRPLFILSLVLVMIVLTGAVIMGTPTTFVVGGTVVYETQTPYQQLRIIDDDGIRTLYLNGQPQSAMDLNNPYRHVYDYTRYFHLPLLMSDNINKVLFIGGGGFTGPKIFKYMYNMSIDVVEIDPAVIAAAKKYFNVTESPELQIYQMDGRQFLQQTNVTYDLIILDAYRKDRVPFHLTTQEFFQLAKSKLDGDGILLANIISAPHGGGSKFFRAEYKTLKTVFSTVYA